jgi:effector-binding domain-containing protein
MAEYNPQYLPSKKIMLLAVIGMLAAVGGGGAVMFYLGAFKNPEVYRDVTHDYRIAYIEHIGSYAELDPVFAQVAEHLKKAGITADTPCALFLDSVSEVQEPERRSKIGYLVKRSDYIPAPLDELIIPSREIVAATFKGGTLLGSYKAYGAMREWSKIHGYKLSLPAFEIYHPDGTVEYQLPIHER